MHKYISSLTSYFYTSPLIQWSVWWIVRMTLNRRCCRLIDNNARLNNHWRSHTIRHLRRQAPASCIHIHKLSDINPQLCDARKLHAARKLSSPKVAVLNLNKQTPLVNLPTHQPRSSNELPHPWLQHLLTLKPVKLRHDARIPSHNTTNVSSSQFTQNSHDIKLNDIWRVWRKQIIPGQWPTLFKQTTVKWFRNV